MSVLSQLNRDTLEERYGYLPENMVAALNSASVKAAVDAIGKEYDFSDTDNTYLEMMVSFVFMGFVHPDMIKAEILEIFDLKDTEAEEMAKKLNQQIFSIYRTDIEKVYSAPVPAAPKPPAAAPMGPTLDLKKAVPAPPPAALPSIPAAPAAPAPAMTPAPGAPKPAAASPGTPAAMPKPFVLQKESSAETVVSSSGFKLNLSPKITGAGIGASLSAPPPRPAQLEIGKEAKKESPKMPAAPAPTPKVVHYTDFKSTLGVMPAPAAGGAGAPAPVSGVRPAAPTNGGSTWGTIPGGSPMYKSMGSNPSSPIAPAVTPAKPAAAAMPPATTGPAVAGQTSTPSSPAPAATPLKPGFIKNAPGVAPFIVEGPKQAAPASTSFGPAAPPSSTPPAGGPAGAPAMPGLDKK